MKTIITALIISTCLSGCKKQFVVSSTIRTNIINQGVSGNTAKALLNRIDSVIKQKPNLVIVMIGTNDAISGGVTFSNFKTTLGTIIDSLHHTGSAVMLLSPPPVTTWTKYNISMPLLDSACSIIRQLSLLKSCYFVDINNDLKQVINASNSHDFYIADGLHPNKACYIDIANYIAKYIKEYNIKAPQIVCFGDSITYGITMNGMGTANGDTYPAVLKRLLNP